MKRQKEKRGEEKRGEEWTGEERRCIIFIFQWALIRKESTRVLGFFLVVTALGVLWHEIFSVFVFVTLVFSLICAQYIKPGYQFTLRYKIYYYIGIYISVSLVSFQRGFWGSSY